VRFEALYTGNGKTIMRIIRADSEREVYSRMLDVVAREIPSVTTEPVASSIVVVTLKE